MPKPKQQVDLLQGYTWDAGVGRYRYKNGTFVARAKIIDLLDTSLERRERRMVAGVQALKDGDVAQRVFVERNKLLLKRQYLQQAALARGGWDKITPEDKSRIGGYLTHEYRRMTQMSVDLTTGKASVPQGQNRMTMYLGNARRIYYNIEAQTLIPGMGMQYIERRLLGRSEHCPDCLTYAGMGWQPLGVLPPPSTQSVCDGNCRCSIERREVTLADAALYLKGMVVQPAPDTTQTIPASEQPAVPMIDDMLPMIEGATLRGIINLFEGGPGSGHHGHRGIPGTRGGSLPASGGATTSLSIPEGYEPAKTFGECIWSDELAAQSKLDAYDWPQHNNRNMAVIAERQGFGELPAVVSSEEFDRLREQTGAEVLWRGVVGDHAEAFRSGAYWAGDGVIGGGTYATTSEGEAREYGSQTFRMMLRPDAKVITGAEIGKLKQPDRPVSTDAQGAIAARDAELAARILGPVLRPTELAASYGYDAVLNASNEGHVVILNRSAVIVDAANYPGNRDASMEGDYD